MEISSFHLPAPLKLCRRVCRKVMAGRVFMYIQIFLQDSEGHPKEVPSPCPGKKIKMLWFDIFAYSWLRSKFFLFVIYPASWSWSRSLLALRSSLRPRLITATASSSSHPHLQICCRILSTLSFSFSWRACIPSSASSSWSSRVPVISIPSFWVFIHLRKPQHRELFSDFE